MINKAFINIKCTLKEIPDLNGVGIIENVSHIFMEKEYAFKYKKQFNKDDFAGLGAYPTNACYRRGRVTNYSNWNHWKLDKKACDNFWFNCKKQSL